MNAINRDGTKLTGEIFGGLASVLVALPSAIAYGLVIYGPLSPDLSGVAVIAGISGTIFIGLMAGLFGGTPGLISAPCAPAAAVLSVCALELLKSGTVPAELIPQYLAITGLCAGLLQLLVGGLGGGRLIKYIPYPVVAGYLSGVGLLIIIGQVPKFFGYPKTLSLLAGLLNPAGWHWESLIVGSVTVLTMIFASKIVRAIPAAISALVAGIAAYFVLSLISPHLGHLAGNKLVIGPIQASAVDLGRALTAHWTAFLHISPSSLLQLAIPAGTLAVLLSIDTLKTCVVLDVMRGTRHNSNRELIGQGLGNVASAFFCGMPGAGTMGATLVNMTSGGRTRISSVLEAVFAVAILLLIGRFIAWIPLASLAGILIVVGVRMIDLKSLHLLRHRSTRLDFFVILAVIVSALSFSLLVASGVGIAMAILLFLREQIQFPVVRRKLRGGQLLSKKRRLPAEAELLQAKGAEIAICELQGQLFFGTADQMYTELERSSRECRYIIIDMRRVRSMDYTAVNMLKQIYGKVRAHGGLMLFSSVPLSLPTGQNIRKYLRYLGFADEASDLKFFPSLEAALEWAEDSILSEAQVSLGGRKLEIGEIEFFKAMPGHALENIRQSMDEKEFAPSEPIFRKDEESDSVFFIRKGTVRIVLPLADGRDHHLASFGQGDFFGDMAFLDRGKRSADAVADSEVSLFVLSRRRFDEITLRNPEVAALLFERLAQELSLRLRQNVIEIQGLEEG